MQIKKLFKYLPMTAMVAGLMLTTGFTPIFQNNFDISGELIFDNSQQVDDGYSNQLEYIRNDVAKQTGVADSIMSINLPVNSSGSNHCAILVTKTDGSTLLYMWGANYSGELGNGTTDASFIPILVDSKIFGSRKIIQMALGNSFSGVILEDGSLYMWGRNDSGQLGIGSTDSPRTTPEKVDMTNLGDREIIQISFGENNCAAITKDGAMYMWGNNYYGQLGNGTINSAHIPTQVTMNFNSRKVTKIFVNASSSAAVLEDNSLWMWGNNRFGQLGNNYNFNTDNPNHTPIQVGAASLVSGIIDKIALGGFHSAALLADGSLYMWGLNNYGQLGNGTSGSGANTFTPTPVDSTPFGSNKIKEISLGSYHSAALLKDGELYMWGQNFYGQLGNENTSETQNPTPIPAKFDQTSLNPGKIIQIAALSNNSSIILDDGSIYIRGRNNNGQLGFPADFDPHPIPVWILQLGKESLIKANVNITASEAVDKIWAGGSFNEDGFKSSFNLVNILEIPAQEITMDTKPIPNNSTNTVTMTVKIKYYYNKNGYIVPNADIGQMDISGFRALPKTNITTKNDPPIVASDEAFMEMIYDADGKLNQVELAKFVDGLDTIPETATILSVDYISTNRGTAIFRIKLSGYYDGTSVDMVNEEKSYDFEVRVEYTAPAVSDPFPWWWIIIGIGGAAIIGVGIWFVIKKSKEAEAKPTDGEPNSEDPKDDKKKTSKSEAKTDNHPIDKTAE